MQKYRDLYQFKYERDSEGKIYNRDDNYIACRAKGKIYKYDKDTLIFTSPKKIRIQKTDKETGEVIKDYTDLILDLYDSDEERIITFKEENIEKLEDLFKIRKKRKLSEEEKAKRAEVLAKKRAEGNTNIEDEDLEDEFEDDNDIDNVEEE